MRWGWLPSPWEGAPAFVAVNVWIGLDDTNKNTVYKWFDGSEPVTYQNFDVLPDAASPDCVAFRAFGGGGRWYTFDCTNQRPAICECDGP